MRSESTSALGQPSETNPTLGLFIGTALRWESRELKTGEHVLRLILHLVLELREHLRTLLHVSLHQALHRGTLHVHELRPDLIGVARTVAIQLLRVLLQRLLHLLEALHVLLK